MTSSSRGETDIAHWSVVSPQGPAVSHHVGAIIRNRFYIHGGIDTKGSTKPLNKLHALDIGSGLETGVWTEIRAPNSPHLSHHASLVIEDRYFIMIGGWDGHKRTTQVFVYDVQEECWLPMNTSGFPQGGGLSSHTATLLHNNDILIVGREGSARLQRRTGNTFCLRGSVLSGEFKYLNHTLEPASRAGHSTHIIGNTLHIYGGRADNVLESHKGYRNLQSQDCQVIETIHSTLSKLSPIATPSKIPCGRKHQVSVAGSKSVFIHGGETFDGKSKDPVGEMIFVVVKPEVRWYRLGSTPVGRAAHVCVVYHGDIFIHGGEGPRNVVYGATYKLELKV